MNAIDRFLAKVDAPNGIFGCWVWQGQTEKGYGRFYIDGGSVRAHRWAYQRAVGPIPEGLVLDHLCRNPSCVNPFHLEAVTQAVNTLRGTGFAAVNAAKTHCSRGHEFTPANTYRRRSGGRECRICLNARVRAWQRRKKSTAARGATRAAA